MTSQYSLLALDLDGTLLNPRHEVTPRTKAAVQRVADTGAAVVFCSGRATFCTTPVEAQLGLKISIPLVCFNGATALSSTDSKSGKRQVLFNHTLTTLQVSDVLAAAEVLGCAVNYYDVENECIHIRLRTEEDSLLMKRYRDLTGAFFKQVQSYSEVKSLPPKLLILCSNVDQVFEYLQKNTAGLKIIRDEFFVECLPAHVNKGAGFKQLCEVLSIPLERTLAFGDGWNDMEFLATAGLGIAMANARDELKRISARTTRSTNAMDGLAEELEAMLVSGAFGSRAAD
ncbi:hypothetical protein HDU83_001179 [Entophlyctis luteolus]|nr:hypothetical protein HDU82_003442 [Entophlyctis luteolus]KAJ3356388.1 hypothetical protein HDU83_001179 [Entophlyctis luteolus]KAJ3394987.1 hypothetical protein HDU84_004445 [Entophlyctis sp. JEL0112]